MTICEKLNNILRRLKLPNHAPFDGLRKVDPQLWLGILHTTKRCAIPRDIKPLSVQIHLRVTLVGESGKKLKHEALAYFSPICPDVPLRQICTNFELHIRLGTGT